jgi:hypothetical protein
VADEFCQGDGQAGGVAGQPFAEELQRLGEFSGVDGVELGFGHEGSLSFRGEPGLGALVGGVGFVTVDSAGLWRQGPGAAGAAQPETAIGWDGAGQGALALPPLAGWVLVADRGLMAVASAGRCSP